MDLVRTRKAGPSDLPFILSSWLKNYKHSSYHAKRIRNDLFFEHHHDVVEKILLRPGTQVFVAHLPDAPDVLLGYLVKETHPRFEQIVHFVFVKKEFRRYGIARLLFQAAGLQFPNVYFTHWTFSADELTKKFEGLIYDPYLV